jgi:Ferritin-like
MIDAPVIKLLPRNVAALRKGQDAKDGTRLVTGNPISTRLESGIGNCFPGLECDLRNLERRFFPCLEVDVTLNEISLVAVDLAAAPAAIKSGYLSKRSLPMLKRIDASLRSGQTWSVDVLHGDLGPLGKNWRLVIAELGPVTEGTRKPPPDAWTAIRLLPEGSKVSLTVRAAHSHEAHQLVGRRARYLDDQGALAAAFMPGEMTQSLCSPWTHDFRDCGCFYWASNHPDIVKPPLPADAKAGPEWNSAVPWERSDRSLDEPPARATDNDPTPVEMDHYAINQRWQELNFVLGGRERVTPYVPEELSANPLASRAALITHLRYAAGVELGVIHEYLAAAFSLRSPQDLKGALRQNVTAAHAELMRLAISEMRHLRAVNDVLRSLHPDEHFTPALQIAAKLPGLDPGTFRPLLISPADRAAINAFIDIEKPSASVDGLYSQILATLNNQGTADQQHAIRTIMAEGEDHFETFQFIREWLRPHQEAQYLRRRHMTVPPKGNQDHQALQGFYKDLLKDLYSGYAIGFPEGGEQVNKARNLMVLPNEMQQVIWKICEQGFLIAFDAIKDPRFVPILPPP